MEGARGKVVAGDGWQTVVLSQNDRLLCASGHCEQVPRGTLPAPIFNPMYPEMVGHDFTAGANDGDTLYLVLDSLYRSSDRGRTFGGGLPFRAAALVKHSGRLLAFGHPPSIVEYWTQRATLISSSNGGLTWHREDSAITAALGSIRFLVSRPGELLGAGDSGVFVRKDGQTAWTDLGEGLPAGIIHALAAEGDMIAVAMEGGPIWVRTLDSPVTGLSRGSRAAPGRASLPGRFKDPASGWRRLDGRALR